MKFEIEASFGPVRIDYRPHIYLDDDDTLYIEIGLVNVWVLLQGSDGGEHEVDIWPSYMQGVYLGPATREDILRDIREHLEEHRDVIKAEHVALWGDRYPFAD